MNARRIPIIPFIVALSLFVSCGKAGQGKPTAALPPAGAQPVVATATVTFVSGTVEASSGQEWKAASVGDRFPVSTRIRTGQASSCELAFGNLGAVRLGSGTAIELSLISIQAAKRKTELSLGAGSLACKVDKLASEDRFHVRSKDAVCGVRGTEFLVKAEAGKPTLVAVQKGSVVLLPPSFEPSRLDAAAASPEAAMAVESFLADVAANAPVVEAAQEALVSSSLTLEVDKAMAGAMDAMVILCASPDVATVSAQPKAVAATLVTYTALAASLPAATTAISPESSTALKDLPAPPEDLEEALPQVSAPLQPGPEPVAAMKPAAAAMGPAVAAPANPPPAPAQEKPAAEAAGLFPRSLKLSDSALVSGLQIQGGRVFMADAKGRLFVADETGAELWKAGTGNGPNENSQPVLDGASLFFLGDATLSAFDFKAGAKIFSIPVDASNSGFFGRRPLLAGGQLFISSDRGLDVLDPQTGKSLGSIDLPDGSDMTPALYGGKLCLATRNGIFCIVDPQKRQVLEAIPSSAIQPISAAPLVSGSQAWFADRKGLVVCLDLAAGKMKWEKRLEAGKSAGVYQDPLMGQGILYFYSKGSLYALAASTGEAAFAPIRGLCAPPALAGGRLWYATTEGQVVAADPATGRSLGAQKLAGAVSGQPALAGDSLFLPMADGSLLILGTQAILR